MKRQRHSEEQIIAVLQEAQAGATIEELCRRHGISQGTKWKQKFSGMEVNDARRLRLLEDENRKLKRLVADQALDMMHSRARRRRPDRQVNFLRLFSQHFGGRARDRRIKLHLIKSVPVPSNSLIC